MKKIIFLLIFLFLLFPVLSAVEIELKDSLDKRETLLAVISGNFMEQLEKDNIFFYREHVKLNLDYAVAKIDNDYYVYALLGDREPGNYSLRIENIQYMQGTTLSDEDIIKPFEITDNLADFSVNPGFIITDEPFNIQVQNLQDFKITIEITENKTEEAIGFFEALFRGMQESDTSVELSSGEIKNLEFDLGNETSFRFVELSTENLTYSIPVYAIVTETTGGEQNESSENGTGTENGVPSSEDEEIPIVSTKTCEQLNGTFCGENEVCSDDVPTYATDGVCCLNTCEEIKKSNTGKILGWTMIIIILIVVIWFFKKKSKRTNREINLLNIAKGKR